MRHVGTGVPAHDIGRRVSRMSVHPGEFSEITHSIPQDWASLAHYLARRGIELGPGPPRQFAGGYGNLNYLIEIDGKPAALRRPPAGRLPYGANDMAREYRILSSLWREYPLALRAMFFCDEASVLGARVPSGNGNPRLSAAGLGRAARARDLAKPSIGRDSRCFACRRPGAS
jgi:hypothetical protein